MVEGPTNQLTDGCLNHFNVGIGDPHGAYRSRPLGDGSGAKRAAITDAGAQLPFSPVHLDHASAECAQRISDCGHLVGRGDGHEAEERAHVVEGLLIALEHIEAVIDLIKRAKDADAAKTGLMAKYGLTDVQAKAILDLRLPKLAQLEVQTLKDEHADLLQRIARYKVILGSRAEQLTIIKGLDKIIRSSLF